MSANPLSFFAVSNLYTISESEVRSQTNPSVDEELSSAHSGTRSGTTSGITALPRWESLRNPLRAHVRTNSEAAILEKEVFTKETERSGATTPADNENNGPSRMAVWLVLVVVVIIALAVVLGAVLGTFVSHSATPQPSVTEIPAGSTPTPTTTTTGGGGAPTSTPAAHFASLAVTGYATPGRLGYFIVSLFYQGTNDYLSHATFNSSTGNWTLVSNFVKAKKGSPLTATTLNSKYYTGQPNYSFPNIRYQSQVVYFDDTNYLNEWIFPDTGPNTGQAGPLNQQKYMAHSESNLAFYWPQLVYQGLSGEIRGNHFECYRKNECWHETVLTTSAATNGTPLAIVPLRNNLSSTGLFYREESGRCVNYKEDNGDAWGVWTSQAFERLIPSASSIAAFSTTRSNQGLDADLSTYLLWQDSNGTVQMSWSDNDAGWKGPIAHPAFAGADENTALACLTGLTFPDFPMMAGSELARCYFQAGALLREVSFDGTSWDVVGNVPIEF